MKKSPKEIIESLSENHDSEMEKSYKQYEHELVDLDYMEEEEKQIDRIVAGILFGILIFGIALILIFK